MGNKVCNRGWMNLILQALLEQRTQTLDSIIQCAPWEVLWSELHGSVKQLLQWAVAMSGDEFTQGNANEKQRLFFQQVTEGVSDDALSLGLIYLAEAVKLCLEEEWDAGQPNKSISLEDLSPAPLLTWSEMRRNVEEIGALLALYEGPHGGATWVKCFGEWGHRYVEVLHSSFSLEYELPFLLDLVTRLRPNCIEKIWELTCLLYPQAARNSFEELATRFQTEDPFREFVVRHLLEGSVG